TPIQTIHGNAVDLEAIRSIALTVRVYLHLVFSREDPAVSLRSSRSLTARSILGIPTCPMRGVVEDAWCQTQELKGITAKGRQILNLFGAQRPADVAGLCVNGRSRVGGDRNLLVHGSDLQRDIYGLGL